MRHLRFRNRMAAGLLAACLFSSWAAADSLPTLTVEGVEDGAVKSVTFDRNELEDMGLVRVATSTPWNEGVVQFDGVPLEQLLETAGVSGQSATVMAINDYSVEIPVSDFSRFGVILAVKRNGEYMPVDDQGPFFIIYPFDSDPQLQGQPYHSRAVWQVKEILVE